MVGRKYTWYKPNGLAKSRVDRILALRDWEETWPSCKQYVMDKTISDQCALMLKSV